MLNNLFFFIRYQNKNSSNEMMSIFSSEHLEQLNASQN